MTASGRSAPVAEYSITPAAFIVHDAAAAGAFAGLDAGLPPEAFLFREHPEPAGYAAQYDAFLAELRRHAPRVLTLAELVDGDACYAATAASPNQVFTRDSLITLPWAPHGYLRARMRPAQRRAESSTLERAVRRLGLEELTALPDGVFLEGGDVVPWSRDGRRTLLVGHGPRSTLDAVRWLRDTLAPAHLDEVLALRLADWRLNLDGGFLFVAENVVVTHRPSVLEARLLDPAGERQVDLWELLESLGVRVIEVTLEESLHAQACNAICLGERRVICYDLCPRVARELERCDVTVYRVPGSELVKGRGGPRCMSRPVYA